MTEKGSQASLSLCQVQFLQTLPLCVKSGYRGGRLGSVSLVVSASAMWGHLQSQGRRKHKEAVSESNHLNWGVSMGTALRKQEGTLGILGLRPPALRPMCGTSQSLLGPCVVQAKVATHRPQLRCPG